MIRIPNRVIALVLAVTMLLSATSLTTFADDSNYNDSGYMDSGTYMEEPQDFSDEYAKYLIQLDAKNKKDGIQSTLWLDYMIKYGKALPYEQTPHSYVYKEPQIQPYQGLRRMRRSLQSNTVTTLGQLPLGAKVVDAATQWGDEPMIWIKSSDHVRVSYGKDLNTTHYGLTHQMDVNDEWGYTSAKGASYYVSEKIIGQFPKSIGYNETYFSNMLLKWLNEPNQNHFLGKNFYTDVLSEDLRRNMQVATFYGNYVYHKTYNNGRKIGKNVIMDAWVGQKGVEFIRAFQGKLENDTQYSYDAGIEDSDLMHKYHPIIGETKPFRPYKGVWGGVDENKNLLPSELVWGGTDGDGRDDDGSDGYYACDSLQNAIGGGSLLLCSGRIAANVRPVIALKDNTKVYAVPDGNGIYTLVPSLEKPVISQTYNSSNNKVIVTATSPQAASMQILKNGAEISYIRGNLIEYEISKNGWYTAKAIQGTAAQTTDFNVTARDELGPQITYTPLPTGWVRSKSTTITLTDAKTPSGMQYQVNGGTWTNYTAPFSYNFTANGSITVNARDKWGNPSSTTTIIANQIDNTPPTQPVITKTPPKPWHKDDVTITIGGGTDAGSGVKGYQYQINNGNWIDYTAPFAVSSSVKINARTVDNVGLVSQPTATDVNIDRIKPTGVITYSKAWTSGSVELTFTATDLGGAGVQHVRPAGGSWTDGNTVKHSVSTNGTHSFEVEDNAGNAERISEEINNIDKVLPVIEEINFVKENDDLIQSILHFFNKQVGIQITASDDASGVDKIEYQLIKNGDTIQEEGWLLYNADELPKVSRRFSGTVAARCTDVATNISEVKEEPVTVEDTPPTATHTLSTTDWTDGTVTIRLKAQDDLSGVASITLPDGTVIDGDTAEFTVSENGNYRFIIADKCGNILNYDVEVKKIDLTPCTATHTLNPIGYTNGRVKITIFAEDKESGVKSITLPDGTVVDGNTASYTVDSNDTYTFKLTNNARTTSGYVVMVDKIDKTNPTITKFELRETQDSPVKQFFRSILPNTNMFRKQVELIVEAEDDHSGVNKIEYQAVPKGSQVLDSGWKTYHGGDKPSRLKKDMNATVHVRTIDNATNISAVVSKDAVIDGTAPTATHTLSTTDWVKDGLDINITAKDNIVGVASITLPDGAVVDGDTATYHVSRNGSYTFVLTDKLGTSCKYIVTISNIEEQLPTPPKADVSQPTDPNQPDELELEWSKEPEELDVKAEAPSGIAKYQYRITKRANPVPIPPEEKLPNKAKVLGTYLTEWLECNGKITVIDEGIFDVNVRSVSFAGNVSPVSKYTVKNDFTPPTVSYNTTRNSIELKAEDNLSGVAKIVCEHGEVLGSEVSCPMKRTEDHVYTVTDNAGNPTVVTVEFKRKSNPSKPDYEPVESEPDNDTKKPPRKPKPSTSVPEQQSSIAEESKTEDAINLPEPEKQPREANSSEPKTGENSETNVWTKVVRILSSFVRNTAEIASNIWSWLMSLPIIWRVVLFSLWWLLLILIAYLIYQKVKENKTKKADKQE